MMIRLNNNWKFSYVWTDEIREGKIKGSDVRLPHNVGDLPLHYASPEDYDTVCGYLRYLDVEASPGKKYFLQFDGAAHYAEVYMNGYYVGKHYGGYTAFRIDITDFIEPGKNYIAVKLDCTENPEIPPFGHVMDYLAYGGLYRDVWLDIRPDAYIEDVFIRTVDTSTVRIDVACSASPDHLLAEITDQNGISAVSVSAFQLIEPEDAKNRAVMPDCRFHYYAVVQIPDARCWSVEDPFLYHCRLTLKKKGAEDKKTIDFGIRTAEFKKDGFYLNHKKVFLRGLNRHQSYPYIGYAAPKRLQTEDARILKQELAVNAVRTSHYPQSRYFIRACDRYGLCVFTEMPGWQHIGDERWKKHALQMLKEMILQYRNHPSVILWGVRINESVDDDPFYSETNALAHALDPSRQTSGVRYLKKSHLLEDVYAFNDFSYDGTAKGCLSKTDVSPDADKPYLISENNGHMYPVKPFDHAAMRQEQALRHAQVLNDAMSEDEIAGSFAWCMFDYATHRDFGSGDRICYHGVLDTFRNPKPAAWFYASQSDENAVLKLGSTFDIGEYPGGRKGRIYAFTNAEEVRLYKNDAYINTFKSSSFSSLPHGPVLIDDMIGEQIKKEEGFSQKQADLIKDLLLSADRNGFEHMPFSDKIKLLYAHFRYHLSYEDGYALYGKYFGNWGKETVDWRFDAVKGGTVQTSVSCSPCSALQLKTSVSSCLLKEGDVYDMALVRIQIVDRNGNEAVYAQLPLRFSVKGVITLEGPEVVCAEGGMCGTFVKTTGRAGKGSLLITAETNGRSIDPVEINFEVKIPENKEHMRLDERINRTIEDVFGNKVNDNIKSLIEKVKL